MKKRILSLMLALLLTVSSVLGVSTSFAEDFTQQSMDINTLSEEDNKISEQNSHDTLEKKSSNISGKEEESTISDSDENKDALLQEEKIEVPNKSRALLSTPYAYVEKDISSSHVNSIHLDKETINDGENITLTVKFNDSHSKINPGNYIHVRFDNSSQKYLAGYSTNMDLSIDGIVVATAYIERDGAKIVFNNEIEKFDHGTVTGELTFTVSGRNISGSDDNVRITSGYHTKDVLIQIPDTGTTSGVFYYKTGHIDTNNPSEVSWFLVVNPDGTSGAWEPVKIHDQIQGVPTEQVLKKGSVRAIINGETYTIQEFENKYGSIIVDYTLGIIDVTINPVYVTNNRISIVYETQIVNFKADYFHNNSTASYYVSEHGRVTDGEFNHSVKNINLSGNITGTVSGELKVFKYIKDLANNGESIPIENVEFKLSRKDGDYVEDNQKEVIIKTNQLGIANIKGLRTGQYKVQEISAPNWIDFDLSTSKVYEFEVKTTDTEGTFLEIENKVAKMNIPVTKEWIGAKTDSVEVELYQKSDNTLVSKIVLNEENNWEGSFENINKYDKNGNEIEYFIKEVSIDGYESKIEGNQIEGYKIINTQIQKVNIDVEKTWIGEKKDSVNIKLFADGKDTDKILELSDSNNWKGTFNNLVEFNENGEKIDYTIQEVGVDGYKTVINKVDNKFEITNISEEKISIPVQKNWIGSPEEEVTINLLKYNNEVVKSIKLSAENNWKGEFEDLFKYDQETGKEIDYSIKEEAIEGYTSVYTGDKEEGFTVTNTITGKVSIGVTKEWVGKNSDEAKVTLLKNSEELETITLNKGNNWQHTFENLDKYDSNGEEINYNIKEIDVDKTKYEITNIEDGYSFKIINKNIEKISVPVKKEWKGSIGEEVTINLLKGEEIVDSIKLSAENNWEGKFENLFKYDQETGAEAEYTVQEAVIDGYDSQVTGNIDEGFTVINTRTGKVNFDVIKEWHNTDNQEDNNLEGIRPVNVHLVRGLKTEDGRHDDVEEKVIEEFTLSAQNNWTYTFEDLDEYDENGNEYYYYIHEIEIPGFTSTVHGEIGIDEEIVLVNKKIDIEKINIPVNKIWKNNLDIIETKAPSMTITLILKDDMSNEVSRLRLNSNNNWSGVFEDIPKYRLKDDNTLENIKYEIVEVTVDGYETEIVGSDELGYTVINKSIKPIEPTEPEKPTDPNPVDPTNPGEPTDPKPVEPTEPGEPTDPKPVDPTEPEKPTDPNPVDPTNPGEPTDPNPEKPINSEKPTKIDEDNNDKLEQKTLPKTGVTESLNVSLIGVLISLLGTFIFKRKNK